jgi:hypothetical protein
MCVSARRYVLKFLDGVIEWSAISAIGFLNELIANAICFGNTRGDTAQTTLPYWSQ